MFNFEKLDAWHHSLDLAESVYSLTRTFPNEERFGLTIQMRRAAVSVSSNLAEGSLRSSRQDYARFVEIAAGSLFEVASQAFLARRLQFLSEESSGTLYALAERQGRMLSGLRSSLLEG